jgi:hypothetical protein
MRCNSEQLVSHSKCSVRFVQSRGPEDEAQDEAVELRTQQPPRHTPRRIRRRIMPPPPEIIQALEATNQRLHTLMNTDHRHTQSPRKEAVCFPVWVGPLGTQHCTVQ